MGATKAFTPKRWKVNGKVSWVIDFTENGKRTRKKFISKTAAEDWGKDQMRILVSVVYRFPFIFWTLYRRPD